jgi:cytochrome c-type biogenesis protein CcmI
MTALLIGAALAVAALVYVLLPLFDVVAQVRGRSAGRALAAPESAIDALREIEFDRATGKLSDDDYSALKAEYTRTALVELRAREGEPAARSGVPASVITDVALPNGVDASDPVEAAVLRYRAVRRSCETCGPRPEPDPAFCSSCGTYLKGACAHCGATIDQPASRFCANCGSSLAA